MPRGVGGVSPANLQKYLAGMSYPASKDELISTARRNSAPSEVVDAIGWLPRDRFRGPQEVQRAYGDIA